MHTFQRRSNAIQIIAMQHIKHSYERLVYSKEWCTIFKGRKMNRSCLCVCFATVKLLLNVSDVILQCFTINAQFIRVNLPCFVSNICTLYKHLFFRWIRFHMQLFRQQLRSKSTCRMNILLLLVVRQLWKPLKPFPNKSWFLPVCSTSLLKTLREKEKLLVTSVFYLFDKLCAVFINLRICSLQTL